MYITGHIDHVDNQPRVLLYESFWRRESWIARLYQSYVSRVCSNVYTLLDCPCHDGNLLHLFFTLERRPKNRRSDDAGEKEESEKEYLYAISLTRPLDDFAAGELFR